LTACFGSAYPHQLGNLAGGVDIGSLIDAELTIGDNFQGIGGPP